MTDIPVVDPMLDNLLDAALGKAPARRLYPWPAKLVKRGDYDLVPICEDRSVLMTGMEIAAGVKPVDVLPDSEVLTRAKMDKLGLPFPSCSPFYREK